MEKTFKNQKQNILKNNKYKIRENYRNTEEEGLANSRGDRSTWERRDNLSGHTLQAGFYQVKEYRNSVPKGGNCRHKSTEARENMGKA